MPDDYTSVPTESGKAVELIWATCHFQAEGLRANGIAHYVPCFSDREIMY